MEKINKHLEEMMALIPSGTENIRSYQDKQKWISSNSQMSIPGSRKNMTEAVRDFRIASFYLSKIPVTKALYDAIVKEIPMGNQLCGVPAVNVSWFNAIEFCNLLSKKCGLTECYTFHKERVHCDFGANGYRLPTDAEWQYACRAGTKKYQYGKIEEIAWYQGNSESMIHCVKEKEPNKFGLYDMLGNIWEWCWDLYDEETYGSYRIFRGGSWASEARECGATCRRRSHPAFVIDDLGFRIAKSVK